LSRLGKEARTCQCDINDRCPQCDRRVKYTGYDATWEAYVERRNAYQRAYGQRYRRVKRLVERLNRMAYRHKDERPKISFHSIEHAWFTHAGQRYPVASAPTSVFRAAVLEKAPAWKHHLEYRSLLRKDELDLCDRWYLLNELARTHRPIALLSRVEQVAG
jgi:hypothetical protein